MNRDGDGCALEHPRHDGRPCGRCRRGRALAAVIAAEPSLPAATVAEAFDAVVVSPRAVRVIADALAADPDVLQVGAPPMVGRLTAELVARGSTVFTLPACVVCGRTGWPLTATGEGGMCSRCVQRATATACVLCRAVKPVAGRTDHGEPMCERCRRARRPRRRCGVCHDLATIARRARDGTPDVCVRCYRPPEAVCSRCGVRRPCHFAEGDEPICKRCAPRPTAACVRCGVERPVSARWDEGPVCERCYRAALHRRGRCAGCHQQRRLIAPAGPDADRCADCAGVALPGNHVCADCGIEDRLYERGRCVGCSLKQRTGALLADAHGQLPAALVPIHDAIVAARQPYAALNWLRDSASAAILAQLADGQFDVSHGALDAHPNSRAANYLRRMLIAHGVLADRDDQLVDTETWVGDLLATIDRPQDRRLIATYATWRVLRRLRARAERTDRPRTVTRHARDQLTAAAGLLDWLADRGLTLEQTRQGDIDTWLTAGPSAYRARDFIGWAAEHGHCRPLTIATTSAITGTVMHPDQRLEILDRLLDDDTLELTDRVAGSLLLAYAQPLSRIVALTLDQIGRDDNGRVTTIRFGNDPIDLPEPLARLLEALIDTPRGYVGIRSPNPSPWLLPGGTPGRPLTASHLGVRLGRLGIDARAGRRAAVLHLAAQVPAAVLADLLHIAPATAVRWVNDAGGDWSRYAATLATEPIADPAE